jgi:hypothetical protein
MGEQWGSDRVRLSSTRADLSVDPTKKIGTDWDRLGQIGQRGEGLGAPGKCRGGRGVSATGRLCGPGSTTLVRK